jgi:hypothetical protein
MLNHVSDDDADDVVFLSYVVLPLKLMDMPVNNTLMSCCGSVVEIWKKSHKDHVCT